MNKPMQRKALLKFLRFISRLCSSGGGFSDDMLDDYFPFVQKAVEIVRRYDHRQILTGVFMMPGVRRTRATVGELEEADGFSVHLPLSIAKGSGHARREGRHRPIGFKDIDRLTQNARRISGDMFPGAGITGAYARCICRRVRAEAMDRTFGSDGRSGAVDDLSGLTSPVSKASPISTQTRSTTKDRAGAAAASSVLSGTNSRSMEDLLAAGQPPSSFAPPTPRSMPARSILEASR